MGKSGPNATFNLFFLGLGWPWVGEFVGFKKIFRCFPTQHTLVDRKHRNGWLGDDTLQQYYNGWCPELESMQGSRTARAQHDSTNLPLLLGADAAPRRFGRTKVIIVLLAVLSICWISSWARHNQAPKRLTTASPILNGVRLILQLMCQVCTYLVFLFEISLRLSPCGLKSKVLSSITRLGIVIGGENVTVHIRSALDSLVFVIRWRNAQFMLWFTSESVLSPGAHGTHTHTRCTPQAKKYDTWYVVHYNSNPLLKLTFESYPRLKLMLESCTVYPTFVRTTHRVRPTSEPSCSEARGAATHRKIWTRYFP